MKATVLVDSERPKVSESEVVSILKKSGIEHSAANPAFGVVVGGDGLFSYQGRQLGIPLLFVGTKSRRPTDSKARLAEVYLTGLEAALREVKAGRYTVVKHRRLEVSINGGEFRGEIFTDVSLEKGADSNCIRYTVNVRGKGFEFTDSAVSNGIVITTAAGSTGYYSYLDKLDHGRQARAREVHGDRAGRGRRLPHRPHLHLEGRDEPAPAPLHGPLGLQLQDHA